MNKTPEQMAHDKIDDQLEQAGWLIQERNKIILAPDCAVAVREYYSNESKQRKKLRK